MSADQFAQIREQVGRERSLLEDTIEGLRCRLEPGNSRRGTAQDRMVFRGYMVGLEQALYCLAHIECLLPAADEQAVRDLAEKAQGS